MFKFLFGRKSDVPQVVRETQRETIERALGEINEITALMDPKPKFVVDGQTGHLELDLPDQLPDEALALPSPADEPETDEAKPANPVPA
ncbi:hypothetical protein [Pelagovum pacificum]|uniref:Uncharacterized protein n=1 Tax=Pelagovum pacificum TaxID=2588711 RepID=A0A5C5GEJ3_9RHOB|nr:hypothetical protein [Pelagovum pacificum]QQA43746.1 hypothetical protein I8N54_03990 [Pelagovum pacificum]TNY33123.1 hypothetical protein FHY64_07545 [Pelagovum pacificum]